MIYDSGFLNSASGASYCLSCFNRGVNANVVFTPSGKVISTKFWGPLGYAAAKNMYLTYSINVVKIINLRKYMNGEEVILRSVEFGAVGGVWSSADLSHIFISAQEEVNGGAIKYFYSNDLLTSVTEIANPNAYLTIQCVSIAIDGTIIMAAGNSSISYIYKSIQGGAFTQIYFTIVPTSKVEVYSSSLYCIYSDRLEIYNGAWNTIEMPVGQIYADFTFVGNEVFVATHSGGYYEGRVYKYTNQLDPLVYLPYRPVAFAGVFSTEFFLACYGDNAYKNRICIISKTTLTPRDIILRSLTLEITNHRIFRF